MVDSTVQQVQLPDGRELQVEVSGPDGGRVLLFCHGTPGSSHQQPWLAEAAHARGWRYVTFSRPGSPGSTRAPGRTVADVAPDAAAVLDAVGAQRALVAGASGGGPHALAIAALLADRIDAALVICGVAPYDAEELDFLAGMGEDNVTEFGLALDGEAALRPFVEAGLPGMRSAAPDQIVASLSSLLPPVDRACLTGELGAEFAASFAAGAATAEGWIDDDLAFTKPWGFDLGAISVPVSLWQGDADLMVPFAHGQWLARRIPGVRAHLEPGEGHLSIAVASVDKMFDELGEMTDEQHLHGNFDERAKTWDDDPAKVERARSAAEAMLAAVPVKPEWRLLEYGAGTGLLSQHLADRVGAVTLADPSSGMRSVVSDKIASGALPADARVWDLDLTSDPVPDERFDVVATLMALHHVSDVERVLAAFATLLDGGGHLCIVDLEAEDGSFHEGHDDFHGRPGFDRDELTQMLIAAGFGDVQFAHCGQVDRGGRDYPMFLATCSSELVR